MAALLKFICENSDNSHILTVLKTFVEKQDLIADTGFLESLKSALLTLKGSNNLSEEFVAKILKNICWPIVYNSLPDKGNNALIGNVRQRLHLCYDLITFCCSVYPESLLREVCEKCLKKLERYSLDKSAMEEDSGEASVTLDLIGYLLKSGVLNASSGELDEKLFQELLRLLPLTNENLCSKVTGLVLPHFLESRGKERSEAVWNVVKGVFQSEVSTSGETTFHRSYAILCGLSDVFFTINSNTQTSNICGQLEFWEIIQKGLVLSEPLTRKRAVYLLKRAIDLLDKQPQDLSVQDDRGNPIFYWCSEKKESLMKLWQDYVLLIETLDEKQVHLIRPVLPRMAAIVAAAKRDLTGTIILDMSWLLTMYQRAAQHDNKYISRWAILDLLTTDLSDSPLLNPCYWWFLYGPLMHMLSEYAIYAKTDDDVRGDPPAVGAAVVSFFAVFAEHLHVADRKQFCAGLLAAVIKQDFTQVPLLFVIQMLASLPPCRGWDCDALAGIRAIFTLIKTFDTHISSAIQSFLLKAVINLTDPERVGWNDIASFLSLLSTEECLCRGGAMWEETVNWVWQIQGSVGSNLEQPALKNVFDFITTSVEAFLDDKTSEITSGDPEAQWVVRMVLIVCDAYLKYIAGSEGWRQVEDIFKQIFGVVQNASSHVYASEDRTQKAALLLSGVLKHMNNTRMQFSKESEGVQHLDDSMKAMESVARAWGPEVLELLMRKLTTASTNCSQVDNRCAFLELAQELYAFMVVSVRSEEGLQVYCRFVENLIAKSSKIISDKQADRYQLSLSEWCCFALSMKSLAWCCTAVRTKPILYPTRLVHVLLQTVAGLDLSSEFSKPQFVHPGDDRDETVTELRTIIRGGWGRLVSDFLEAQWLCVEFLLQKFEYDADSTDQGLWDELESFMEHLPEAALEVLSLGSRHAVLPIIRCVRLLTPRMLLKDPSLCSQAMDAVWWTFQDRQKRDHTWFWGTLKEITRVFFNPYLLMLPGDHPVTSTVVKYWGELLALGEERPGVFNHVMSPCCQFWSNCDSDALISRPSRSSVNITEEARKKSLEVHLDLITEACIFGPKEKKTKRVTIHVVQYVRRLSEEGIICRLNIDELRDDTRVRVNAINTIVMLNPRSELDQRILTLVTRAMFCRDLELWESKARSSINSFMHRRRHRVWQVILVVLYRLQDADPGGVFAREVLDEIFRAVSRHNQVSVRDFLEWGMLIIFGRYPNLQPLLWQHLKYDPDMRTSCVSSFITVAALLGEYSFPDPQSQAAFFRQALPAVLPWVLTSNVAVQVYAQIALQKMWMVCQQQNLQHVLSELGIIKSCVDFLETNNEGVRQKTKVLGNCFFFDVHPYRDFSIQTLFDTLPRMAEVTDEEWISPKVFTLGSLGMRVWKRMMKSSESDCRGLPLYNPKDTRLAQCPGPPYFNYVDNMGEQISRRLSGKISGPRDNEQASVVSNGEVSGPPTGGDVQRKITPWKVIPPDEEMMMELQHQRMMSLHKSSAGNLIVVASLINKAANLGGLCRTCEIFGVQSLVLSNTHVIEDVQFKSLSVSAAKWMSLQEVKVLELKPYLESMRHEGYTLIGVEQTANSEKLNRYQFPRKSLLLLGNEKEGIPVELIQMLDVCVEIPQVGVIRSLNVHVSGALLVWEYTRQRVLGRASHDC